jgi:hypothetical protein
LLAGYGGEARLLDSNQSTTFRRKQKMTQATSTNGSKGSQPKTTQNQSESPSNADPVAAIQSQADSVIEALHQAGLANAATAIKRHVQALEVNTNELTQTLETLLDPDLPLALAQLRAARSINDRLGKRRELPVGGFKKVSIDVPATPTFSRFYAQEMLTDQSQLAAAEVH